VDIMSHLLLLRFGEGLGEDDCKIICGLSIFVVSMNFFSVCVPCSVRFFFPTPVTIDFL
jgi:hypothetical protein